MEKYEWKILEYYKAYFKNPLFIRVKSIIMKELNSFVKWIHHVKHQWETLALSIIHERRKFLQINIAPVRMLLYLHVFDKTLPSSTYTH